jgi:hypothetical protein
MVVVPGDLNCLTEVRFQGVARANQAQPTYSALTCRSAACPDVSNWSITPGDGTDAAPTWTTVDGSQRRCTSCHGMPPPLPHEQRSDCASCHRDAAPDGGFSAPELHVNGRVDFGGP